MYSVVFFGSLTFFETLVAGLLLLVGGGIGWLLRRSITKSPKEEAIRRASKLLDVVANFPEDDPTRKQLEIDARKELLTALGRQQLTDFSDTLEVAENMRRCAEGSAEGEELIGLIKELIEKMFNDVLSGLFRDNIHLDMLHELAPDDGRLFFWAIENDINFLRTVKLMKEMQLTIIETPEKEITNHVEDIDTIRLRKDLGKLADLLGLPNDYVRQLSGYIDFIEQGGNK